MVFKCPIHAPLRHSQRFAYIVCCMLLAFAALTGCGRKKTRVPIVATPTVGAIETGVASWYGHPYHGRHAANGEVYDMEKMTAAHRTLEFGTWVRVHNLDNSKTVDVRITDRGPFVNGRIIDLSRAAARRIEMIGPGTARVRIEVIDQPPHAVEEDIHFAVQVGAFRNADNANELMREMKELYGHAELTTRDGDPSLWRVIVGNRLTQEAAKGLAERIRNEAGPAFVVRVE